MTLRDRLYQAAWFSPVRYILSLLYGFIVRVRNTLYNLGVIKIQRVKTPVISVGNITAGGSGKTVLVQAIAKHLISLNIRPAVLSRGYGRKTRGLVIVADENGLRARPDTGGDEPCQIAMNYPGMPVVVAEDRVQGARYIEASFDVAVILLDDGFQHRRLHRDLNILIIDSPALNKEHLLPRGRLREPPAGSARADIILYSKAGLQDDTEVDLVFQFEAQLIDENGPTVTLENLPGKVGLFAGIGNPGDFFSSLSARLGNVEKTLVFSDHMVYGATEHAQIRHAGCDCWVTTQKDFIKLPVDFCRENKIYYLPLKTDLPPILLNALKNYFN